jgi:hypothetical protein
MKGHDTLFLIAFAVLAILAIWIPVFSNQVSTFAVYRKYPGFLRTGFALFIEMLLGAIFATGIVITFTVLSAKGFIHVEEGTDLWSKSSSLLWIQALCSSLLITAWIYFRRMILRVIIDVEAGALGAIGHWCLSVSISVLIAGTISYLLPLLLGSAYSIKSLLGT